MAIQYFNDLFRSSNSENYSDFFQNFPAKVTSSMNHHLTMRVSAEEVKDAVFSIKPDSAPGAGNRPIHTSTECHSPDQYINTYHVLKHTSTHNIFKFLREQRYLCFVIH